MNFEDRVRNISISNATERDRYRHHELVSSNDHEVDQSNTDDIIYYNFEVSNPADNKDTVDLTFDVNRVEPILDVSSDYEYAVERFSCPSSFPIYIEDQDLFPLNIRLARYEYDEDGGKVLEYATDDFTVDVNRLDAIPNNPNFIQNGVYDYQALTNAIKNTLSACVVQYLANNPGVTSIRDPYMRYFPKSGNFTLYAPIKVAGTDIEYDLAGFPELVPGYKAVEIQFSNALAKLFNGLYQWYADDGRQTMIIRTTFGTSPENFQGNLYLFNTTQWDVRPEMEQFKKILFLTDSVPVRDELIGEQRSQTQRQLFDYVISNRLNNNDQINFFPQYLKWNNLESNTEMRRINMRVFLQYINGQLYPLKLQPGDNFSAKLVFKKKKVKKVTDVARTRNE